MGTTTRLINIGIVPTIKNSKITIGNRVVFNYGSIYRVTGIWKTTPKGRILILKSETSGKTYERRFLNSGHMAVVDEKNRYLK